MTTLMEVRPQSTAAISVAEDAGAEAVAEVDHLVRTMTTTSSRIRTRWLLASTAVTQLVKAAEVAAEAIAGVALMAQMASTEAVVRVIAAVAAKIGATTPRKVANSAEIAVAGVATMTSRT